MLAHHRGILVDQSKDGLVEGLVIDSGRVHAKHSIDQSEGLVFIWTHMAVRRFLYLFDQQVGHYITEALMETILPVITIPFQ